MALERTSGRGHPDLIKPLSNLGRVYMSRDLPAEAEPIFQRALGIAETSWGPEHPFLAEILLNEAGVLRKLKRRAAAEQLDRRARAILARADTGALRKTVHVADLGAGR
jgi:hypothetical protein